MHDSLKSEGQPRNKSTLSTLKFSTDSGNDFDLYQNGKKLMTLENVTKNKVTKLTLYALFKQFEKLSLLSLPSSFE